MPLRKEETLFLACAMIEKMQTDAKQAISANEMYQKLVRSPLVEISALSVKDLHEKLDLKPNTLSKMELACAAVGLPTETAQTRVVVRKRKPIEALRFLPDGEGRYVNQETGYVLDPETRRVTGTLRGKLTHEDIEDCEARGLSFVMPIDSLE